MSLGGMVQLSTFPMTDAIPRSEGRDKFPVLVRVGAATTTDCAPVDLVAVLDVSCGGTTKRLELLEKAMEFVIKNLSEQDSLAIVPFNASDAVGWTNLMRMSDEGRSTAFRKVRSLAAGRGTKLPTALKKAVEILDGRRPPEKELPVGSIILISDGDDRSIFVEDINAKYPVHAFGFRDAHDTGAMHHIADRTSGVYAVLDDDRGGITDAFEACVCRVKSVVAVGTIVKLKVSANYRVSLVDIESGSFKRNMEGFKSNIEGNESGQIQVNTLCAGEVKNFLVYVGVVAEEDSHDVTELFTVQVSYMHPISKKSINLEAKMTVKRPERANATVVSADVAAELVRVEAVKIVTQILAKYKDNVKGLATAGDELRDQWSHVKVSENARYADAARLAVITWEIQEMEHTIRRGSTGMALAYMLSWVTRQKLQLRITAEKVLSPWSSLSPLPSFDKAKASTFRSGPDRKRRCVELDIIEKRLKYWCKVKRDLPLMFTTDAAADHETVTNHEAAHCDHVATFFSEASLEVINRAMFQDVYLATMHASSLTCCYSSFSGESAEQVPHPRDS